MLNCGCSLAGEGPGRRLAAHLYANASKRGEHNAQYAYAQLLRIGGMAVCVH